MSMKRVYRRIWAWYLSGVILFFAILVFGGRQEGKSSLSLYSKPAWLLLLPAACIVYGAYTSARYWRCEYCGASLTTQLVIKCNKCGRKIDYS